jgi:hypothetical protein
MPEINKSTLANFNEFWQRYPRKVGKGAARKAYGKAAKKVAHDDVMHALSVQMPALESKEQQYMPHASTWLNGERWDDEPEQPTLVAKNSSGHAGNEQAAIAAGFARTPSESCF